jgi:hypothetical protein
MPDKERILELALKGLEAERAKIDDEIAQIKSQLKNRPTVAKGGTEDGAPTRRRRKRRRMSAEAKRKISEAMKRRYAEMRKAAGKKAS